jgi:hypothetical protein
VFDSLPAENSPSARLEKLLDESVNRFKQDALKNKRSIGGDTIKSFANSLYKTFVKDVENDHENDSSIAFNE